MAQDFSSVRNLSADEYRKLLEAGEVEAPEIPTSSRYDLIPNREATKEESEQLNQDWQMFLSRHPAFVQNENNAKKIIAHLTKHRATSSLRNLETAYSEIFHEFEFTIEKDVTEHAAQSNGSWQDKPTRAKSKGLYIATAQPQPAKRKTETRIVKGGDLTSAEQAKLLKPSREREVNRVENLSADDFYKEFLDNEDDHLPDVIVARIKRAIGEFLNACPDYDASDSSNRKILELYFENYKKQYGTELPRDNAMTYINAWRFYKENQVVPVAPTDEIVVNGRKLGRQNPTIAGTDPTYHLDNQLRRKIRAMSSVEFYEFCSQRPDIKKIIDEEGL